MAYKKKDLKLTNMVQKEQIFVCLDSIVKNTGGTEEDGSAWTKKDKKYLLIYSLGRLRKFEENKIHLYLDKCQGNYVIWL